MKKFFFIAISAMLLFACNTQSAKDKMIESDMVLSQDAKAESNEIKTPPPPQATIPVAADTTAVAETETPAQNTPPLQQVKPVPVPVTDWSKKLIKTANLRLEVNDFKAYAKLVQSEIQKYGGYIADEESRLYDGRMENVLTIKVPVPNFEALVNGISVDKGKMIERNIKTQDVTGEVVDTRSRLEAKKAMRLKYLEFLKQSKNMEEVLQVQNEINSIQEEIESASARFSMLNNQSAFSTINLTYYQPGMVGEAPSDNAPFFSKLAEAFKSGAKIIGDVLLFVIRIWPVTIIILAGILFYRRRAVSKIVRKSA